MREGRLYLVEPKPTIRSLPLYNPGKSSEEVKREFGLEHIIKLASNENPFGCSPYVLRYLLSRIKNIALYPDGSVSELRKNVSDHLGVNEQQLIFGNGSEEIIQLISRCFLDPHTNIVMADMTFPLYKINGLIEG